MKTMKTWEIYNYIYEDVCGDSWYGKDVKLVTIGFVIDTEDNVKALVDEINAKRRSRYPRAKPEDEWDRDFEDADYIAYAEYGNVKISTFDEIKNHYNCKHK